MTLLGRLARTPLARPARALVNRAVRPSPRVVTIRGGVARGARMALDLTREKAYWLGHYEPELQDVLAASVRAGDVVYDVGAHVGFFSVCAARLGARVYAFEPNRANAIRLRQNLELNAADAEVVEAAVWRDDAGVDLVEGGAGEQAHVTGGGVTPSVSLDAFVASNEAPLFIKIDAEGAEAEILRGARALLSRPKLTLVCELHGAEARDEVLAQLDEFDVRPLGSEWRILATRDHVATLMPR